MNIYKAVNRGDVGLVRKLIMEGTDVNKTFEQGQTVLMCVSNVLRGYRNLDIVKELIKAGADVNKANMWGWTALIIASDHDHDYNIKVVKELIKAGADVHKKNDDGNTALMIALQNGNTKIVKIIKEQIIKDTKKCLLLPHDIVYKIVMEML